MGDGRGPYQLNGRVGPGSTGGTHPGPPLREYFGTHLIRPLGDLLTDVTEIEEWLDLHPDVYHFDRTLKFPNPVRTIDRRP